MARDQRVVTIGTTDSPLIGTNPKRTGVTFISHATNRYTVNIAGPAVLDQGITVYAGQRPITLTQADYG